MDTDWNKPSIVPVNFMNWWDYAGMLWVTLFFFTETQNVHGIFPLNMNYESLSNNAFLAMLQASLSKSI